MTGYLRRMAEGRRTGVPVPASGTAGTDPDHGSGLARAITPKLLLLFIVGDILGGGIYALVGEVGGRDRRGDLDRVPARAWSSRRSPPAPTPSWSPSTRRPAAPRSTSTRRSSSRLLTFIVAFAVMCSGITSAATLARAFGGDYLAEFVDVAGPGRASRC